MDSNVRSVFYNSSYRRVASIALTSACILCCIPQHAYCLAKETIAKEILKTSDIDLVKDQLDIRRILLPKNRASWLHREGEAPCIL